MEASRLFSWGDRDSSPARLGESRHECVGHALWMSCRGNSERRDSPHARATLRTLRGMSEHVHPETNGAKWNEWKGCVGRVSLLDHHPGGVTRLWLMPSTLRQA